jgi:glycosyltransferase involved in cell wall biosynthesis
LGDGPTKNEFVKRTKLLGIEKQVVFEKEISEAEAYLKSANILIVTDTDAASEEIVLKGAAAGIPMVMSRTERREDLFIEGSSAFLCEPTNVQSFTSCIDKLLNGVALRKQFGWQTQDMIKEKFHHNPNEYRESYRASIEQAFFVDSDSKE